MKYTDIATRLEQHDAALAKLSRDRKRVEADIRSLERRLETAKEKARQLRDETTSIQDQRTTTIKELNTRLTA